MKATIFQLIFLTIAQIAPAQIWQPLGNGFPPNEVRDIFTHNGSLMVSGNMATSGIYGSIQQWNGSSWQAYTNGLFFGAGAYDSDTLNGDLYAGGRFINMFGIPNARAVAKYDGANWNNLGYGVTDGDVAALKSYKGNIYIGGNFLSVDSQPMRDIARWDGTTWHPIGVGTSGGLSQIFCMAVFNNELYVGGYFSSIDTVTAYNIIKFNGTTWSPVGGGTTGDVRCMAVDTINNRLYVGGIYGFNGVANNCPSKVGYWDGSNWFAVGTVPEMHPLSLGMYKGKIVAGTGYRPVNLAGDTINHIAYFDGTDWKNLGSGVNSTVYALMQYNNLLVVGGYFDIAGGMPANRIAAYIDTTTNLTELNPSQNHLTIIPNPASTQITVKLSSQNQFIQKAEVTNLSGQLLFSQQQATKTNSINIPIAALPKGTYYITVFSNGNKISKQFIKN
ncbi:MAG: T9SS type A sorting domain-containing protein [Bacteroidetes bacterium]|nr:T9SS type A sorting domain-containing protein [Bacteroidota bacterium]